jgi:hypothetical protein
MKGRSELAPRLAELSFTHRAGLDDQTVRSMDFPRRLVISYLSILIGQGRKMHFGKLGSNSYVAFYSQPLSLRK